jgi:tripartite-type tricarboxylate transporter receptor subunit TctC
MAKIVYAGELVTIIWPFDTGSNQANFVRATVEEANKLQTKYTFVYDNKPGAGGTIAARTVLGTRDRIVLMSSTSSFFSRPIFYPNEESYNIDDFQPVMIQCYGQPYSIISSKYKTLADVKKQTDINIGIALGTLQEAVAKELQTKLPNTKLNFIGYTGTIKSEIDLESGVLDLSIGFPGDIQQHVDAGLITVLGSTGRQSYAQYPTLQSQGVSGFEDMVLSYTIYGPATLDKSLVTELHNILSNAAAQSPILPSLYANDRCTPMNLSSAETSAAFTRWKKYWREKLASLK